MATITNPVPAINLGAMSLNLTQLQYLNLIKDLLKGVVLKNMLLVGTSPDQQIITVINPNLYILAVQYYGDANLWTAIAQANGYTGPKLNGTYTILIPPPPTVGSGGILSPT